MYVLGLFSRWQPPPKNCQRLFFPYYSDLCPRFRSYPVLIHIDLSVSARHHTSRIPVRSWRLLRVSAAACVSSDHVRCKLQFWLIWGWCDWSTSRPSQPPPVRNCPKSRRPKTHPSQNAFFSSRSAYGPASCCDKHLRRYVPHADCATHRKEQARTFPPGSRGSKHIPRHPSWGCRSECSVSQAMATGAFEAWIFL